MKITITELAKILEKEFKGENFQACDCRNKRPGTGWAIVGHPGITRAIKEAGLPYNSYWSGSNPTPSTQAPQDVVVFAHNFI